MTGTYEARIYSACQHFVTDRDTAWALIRRTQHRMHQDARRLTQHQHLTVFVQHFPPSQQPLQSVLLFVYFWLFCVCACREWEGLGSLFELPIYALLFALLGCCCARAVEHVALELCVWIYV